MAARRRIFFAFTVLLAGGLSLVGGELVVRLGGHEPWRPVLPLSSRLPVLHEPDPELGWRNRAGTAVWPGRGADRGRDIVMGFWPDGLRATAPERSRRGERVVLLGGSFAQGWAVTNEETAGWELQEAFPTLEILNFGTAGYGTFQSLLALERHLAVSPGGLRRVVYGFVDFHESRNVASAGWLRTLSRTSRVGELQVPRAALAADGSLLRHAPERTAEWPLRRQLALSAFLEGLLTRFRARGREEQGEAVTRALIVELDRLARAHGAELLIAVLSRWKPGAFRRYEGFFREQGLAWADCSPPGFRSPSMKVPGYGHPGREANAWWASCIGDRLREMR